MSTNQRDYSPPSFISFNTFAVVGISIIVLFLDSLGPQRYWLVGFLLLGVLPTATIVRLYARPKYVEFVEPTMPVVSVIAGNFVIPGHWHSALALALILALAPGYNRTENSHIIYIWQGVILFVGFGLVGWLQSVPDFEAILIPCSFIFAVVIHHLRWEKKRELQKEGKSAAVKSLTHAMGGIAHDMNNTLVGALAYSELALTKIDTDHPARREVELARIDVLRAAELSRGLQAFAGGSGTSDKKVIDVSKDIKLVIDMLKPWASPKIKIEFLDVTICANVRAGRDEVHRMFLYILINAIDAMQGSWGVVNVNLSNSQDTLLVRVTDHGGGTPGSLVNQVFEPFLASQPDEHGFGLEYAKSTAEAHQGQLEISQNSAGDGTSVTISLPLDKPT